MILDTDAAHITAVLQSHAIPVLRNRSVSLEREGKRLWLSGVDDVLAGKPDLELALTGIPPDEPVVLLAHEPDWADYVAHHPVDLQLSGHSHGGQVRLPLVGASLSAEAGAKISLGTAPDRSPYAVHQCRNRHDPGTDAPQLPSGNYSDHAPRGLRWSAAVQVRPPVGVSVHATHPPNRDSISLGAVGILSGVQCYYSGRNLTLILAQEPKRLSRVSSGSATRLFYLVPVLVIWPFGFPFFWRTTFRELLLPTQWLSKRANLRRMPCSKNCGTFTS